MIVLKKENHYRHCFTREEAQKLVNDGYEVQKNKLGGPRIVKEVKKAAPKKKMFTKKKQFLNMARSRSATTLEMEKMHGNK